MATITGSICFTDTALVDKTARIKSISHVLTFIHLTQITKKALKGIDITLKMDVLSKYKKCTYSSVLHSHKVRMKLCPCERYRQLNSVLYPINYILKSSKIIFNGLVLIFLNSFLILSVSIKKV